MEITKKIIRVGNSAGVLLPRELVGGKAKIMLVEEPLNIVKDTFEIVKPDLCSVEGIYLVGSYAREEQNSKSDVDILIITSDINKKRSLGKYNLVFISQANLKQCLQKNMMPFYPMLIEAKAILNKSLLKELLELKFNKNSFKASLDSSESSLRLISGFLELSDKNVGAGVIYPLILRLRELFIINCILKKVKYKNKEFINFIKEHSKKAKEIYEIYLAEKSGLKSARIETNEVEKLYVLAKEMLEEQKSEIKNRYD